MKNPLFKKPIVQINDYSRRRIYMMSRELTHEGGQVRVVHVQFLVAGMADYWCVQFLTHMNGREIWERSKKRHYKRKPAFAEAERLLHATVS